MQKLVIYSRKIVLTDFLNFIAKKVVSVYSMMKYLNSCHNTFNLYFLISYSDILFPISYSDMLIYDILVIIPLASFLNILPPFQTIRCFVFLDEICDILL